MAKETFQKPAERAEQEDNELKAHLRVEAIEKLGKEADEEAITRETERRLAERKRLEKQYQSLKSKTAEETERQLEGIRRGIRDYKELKGKNRE